jgi:hypothetical protein
MSHWWVYETSYRNHRIPCWTNKEECIEPSARERYEEPYYGSDRRLSGFLSRPRIELDHHERRPLAMRPLSDRGFADWKPFFLMSAEFAGFLRKIDPDCLETAPCDFSYPGSEPTSRHLLADASLRIEATELFDRAKSHVSLQFSSEADPRRPNRLGMALHGPVKIKSGVKIERSFFRVALAWSERIMISDEIAEALFSTRFPGITLEDATGSRKAPDPFRLHSHEAWDEVFPA